MFKNRNVIIKFCFYMVLFIIIPDRVDAISYLCKDGTALVYDGDSSLTVESKCGAPMRKNYLGVEKVHGKYVSIEKWTYNPGYGGLYQILEFHNNIFVNITSGSRVNESNSNSSTDVKDSTKVETTSDLLSNLWMATVIFTDYPQPGEITGFELRRPFKNLKLCEEKQLELEKSVNDSYEITKLRANGVKVQVKCLTKRIEGAKDLKYILENQ